MAAMDWTESTVGYANLVSLLYRVVPDTDLAGHPANNFAGYWISSWPDNWISG